MTSTSAPAIIARTLWLAAFAGFAIAALLIALTHRFVARVRTRAGAVTIAVLLSLAAYAIAQFASLTLAELLLTRGELSLSTTYIHPGLAHYALPLAGMAVGWVIARARVKR